ncbi:DegT/DnrJ/EryC1/StrS family aminotransferase [Streptomyces sp. NPDC050636]|uniref:DegT/DnrJ/EryC1/StrS family aminotransferase n=1 Tax=Streptomyces sp. NPDC050636 TaxID=3154510 RepID=UPI003421EB77
MPGPGFEFLGDEERHNIEQVLKNWSLTRYLSDDPEKHSFVRRLERDMESLFRSGPCVAVNSGTSALAAALAGLGIGAGDEVIVPGYTYVASIGSIGHFGATPVLAEVDETLTLDPDDVERRITPKTRAIMAVHMLGAPCDMRKLRDIAERHGIWLIEDAAQACGGSFQGARLGTIGDAGAYSFNPFKVITSGEGGVAVFHDYTSYARGFAYQDQGWPPLRDNNGVGKGEASFGLNLRMPELSAAVACAQLERVDHVLTLTRRIRDRLSELIGSHEGMRQRKLNDADGDCANVLVYTFDSEDRARRVAEALQTKPLIDSGRHYYGNMPQLSGNSSIRYARGDLPRTDDLLSRSVAISVGVSDAHLGSGFGVAVRSTDEDIARAAEKFNAAVTSAALP